MFVAVLRGPRRIQIGDWKFIGGIACKAHAQYSPDTWRTQSLSVIAILDFRLPIFD
jgi:hypothetical protein